MPPLPWKRRVAPFASVVADGGSRFPFFVHQAEVDPSRGLNACRNGPAQSMLSGLQVCFLRRKAPHHGGAAVPEHRNTHGGSACNRITGAPSRRLVFWSSTVGCKIVEVEWYRCQ